MTPKQWKRLFIRTILWLGIIAGGLLLLFLGGVTWTMYQKERAARQAHLDEAQTLAGLAAREQTLSQDVQNLGTSRGVEAQIRERYPVAKPGESVIVVTPASGAASGTAPEGSQTLWGRFLGLFSWL